MWETRRPSAPILCCFYIPGCCVLGRLLNFPEPASAPRPMDKYLRSTSLGTRNDEFKLCRVLLMSKHSCVSWGC